MTWYPRASFPKINPPPPPGRTPTNGNENKPNRQSVASVRILLQYCRQPYKNTPRYFEIHSKHFFFALLHNFYFFTPRFLAEPRRCSAEQWLAISDLHKADQLYMPTALLPRKKPRYYPLHRRLGGSKRCGEQKNILPRPPSPYPDHYNDRQVS